MRLLLLLTAVTYAGAEEFSADREVICRCHPAHLTNVSLLVHCSKAKDDGLGINCVKSEVVDWNLQYQLLPNYALVRLCVLRRPWLEALEVCRRDGAELAVPADRWAAHGLLRLMAPESNLEYVHLGVRDLQQEGVYRTADGGAAPFVEWEPGQPDGSGRCVVLQRNLLWRAAPCDLPAAFFCQRRIPADLPVSYRWAAHAGRFYRKHWTMRTHAAASAACRAENASLATPDTWARAEDMLRFTNSELEFFHVGFTDVAVEGDFVTDDGRHLRDMEYLIWHPDQPKNDDGGKEEDCLAIQGSGFYDDVRCDKKLRFLCELAP